MQILEIVNYHIIWWMIMQHCQILISSLNSTYQHITALIKVYTKKARFKWRLFYCGEAAVSAERDQLLTNRVITSTVFLFHYSRDDVSYTITFQLLFYKLLSWPDVQFWTALHALNYDKPSFLSTWTLHSFYVSCCLEMRIYSKPSLTWTLISLNIS